jgi:COP9 signalosome complex subunit 3
MLETECRAYAELAAAYATHAPDKLRRAAEERAAVFAADGNAGLAAQAVASLSARNIQRLTSTYVTVSLQAREAAGAGLRRERSATARKEPAGDRAAAAAFTSR